MQQKKTTTTIHNYYVIGKSHTQPSASDSAPWTNVELRIMKIPSNIRCLSLMHTEGIFHKFIVDKNANAVLLRRGERGA